MTWFLTRNLQDASREPYLDHSGSQNKVISSKVLIGLFVCYWWVIFLHHDDISCNLNMLQILVSNLQPLDL